MSSPVFPILNLDVSARRADRRLASVVLCSSSVALALLQQPVALIALVTAGSSVSLLAWFWRLGWVGGPHRIVKIACQSDGRWLLGDAADRSIECALSGASRATSFAVWLRWQGQRRSVLLLPGDIPSADFRRLVVRLRLWDRDSVQADGVP